MSEPCHQEMEKTAGHLDPFECLFYQNGHGICHFHFVLLSNTDCRRAFLEAKAAAAAVRSQQEEKQAATPGSQGIIHPSAREQFPSHLKPAGKLGLQSWVGRGWLLCLQAPWHRPMPHFPPQSLSARICSWLQEPSPLSSSHGLSKRL